MNSRLDENRSPATAAGTGAGGSSGRLFSSYGNAMVAGVFALCIIRLWLMPLPSSFWVDEMATLFVVRNGPDHASLAIAPQVPDSIYYLLPWLMHSWAGASEIALRLPSLFAMLGAFLLIGRITSRLISPQAGWFVAFGCLSLRGFNYQAADARPYALGTLAATACVLMLIRWLDSGRWMDALFFIAASAFLWRVHLVFWPFYLALVIYAIARLAGRETPVSWRAAGVVFGLAAIALIPVLFRAIDLNAGAGTHVVAELPSGRELGNALKFGLVAGCCTGAVLIGRWLGWTPNPDLHISRSSMTLILTWWLCQPLGLFAYSWISGHSIFVARYLFLALPGAAMLAAVIVAPLIPAARWRLASLVLGISVLALLGQWNRLWPLHHDSDWKGAAAAIRQLDLQPDDSVICPSPFIEAKPPVWTSDYALPGFLYSHLDAYPIPGKTRLFPFESSPQGKDYATEVLREVAREKPGMQRFVIYGGRSSAQFWRDWYVARPELEGWSVRTLGQFGDVLVVVFQKQRR